MEVTENPESSGSNPDASCIVITSHLRTARTKGGKMDLCVVVQFGMPIPKSNFLQESNFQWSNFPAMVSAFRKKMVYNRMVYNSPSRKKELK